MGGENMTGMAKYLPANSPHTGRKNMKLSSSALVGAVSTPVTTVDAWAANKTLMERSLEDSPA